MSHQKLYCLNIHIMIIMTAITKEALIMTWVNVDRGLGSPLVAHGPCRVDQAPVGWPRNALIGPPGGPGVGFGEDLEWQHKQ